MTNEKTKIMYHWDWEDWSYYITLCHRMRTKKGNAPITDRQKVALENLHVPDAVIAQLNKREAGYVIDQRIEETEVWIKEKQAQEQGQHDDWVALPTSVVA